MPAPTPARKVAPATTQKAPVRAAAPAPVPTQAVAVRAAPMAVALPADLQAELASHAKEAAALERPSVSRISLKSGVMSFGGAPVAGNAMECIIVAAGFRNTYYAGRYDPNNIVNPNCFALSEDGIDMEPHENVENPMHESCKGCPMNEWGSAGNGSRGKACKEGRRLLLIPANILDDVESEEEAVEAVSKSEMAILDVPVTSVKNWGNLVNALSATLNLPVWAVVTYVEVVPDARTQFQVRFTPVRAAGDAEVLRALMKRRDEAMRLALQPYEGTGGEADPEAGKPAPAAKTAPAAKKKF